MRRVLRLRADQLAEQRPAGAAEDVHFPEALVEAVLEDFSGEGDRILDPFAGYGTTLVVSQRLGRLATGIELLPERVAFMQDRLAGGSATVLKGDARELDELDLGLFRLCFTSPPYMNAFDHRDNPLTGYRTMDGSYPIYLAELSRIFAAVARHLEPGGHLVINAANIRTGQSVTPLAFDIGRLVGEHLRFRGEIYLDWDRLPSMFSGDYCLVFQRA